MKEQEQASKAIEVDEQPNAEMEHSRREFITKLVTTAGAVAAAGLIASGDAANADALKTPGTLGTTVHKETVVYKEGTEAIKWQGAKVSATRKVPGASDGFRVVVSGKEVGQALQQAGLLRQGINLDNAKITIEFTT